MAREPATSSAQRAKSSMTLCCSLPKQLKCLLNCPLFRPDTRHS
jgi:hypothetical protein